MSDTKHRALRQRLYNLTMAWTVFTTVFVWLPIVRILARPEGYTWSFFGSSGMGRSGPFWIFPILALYATVLFAHAWWERRLLFRILLLLWHLGWTAMLTVGALTQGSAASWQGQAWGLSVPLWSAAVVFFGFTLLVAWWASLDWQLSHEKTQPAWTRKNTRRLMIALTLLPVAFLLFRWGSDYNWVTALAVGVTIIQWVTLCEAFEAQAPAITRS